MRIEGRNPQTGKGMAVEVADGRIVSIEAHGAASPHYLAAGLIDLQVNGFRGIDLNDGALTPDAVLKLCMELASVGVTTFQPTLITAAESSIVAALVAIAGARKQFALARQMIVGVHVEGPSISRMDGPRGAHPAEHVRAPEIAEFERWQAASGDLVAMITLAPEHPGSTDYIRALSARGVHVAIGHTAATPEEIHAAASAGACVSTHLGNGAAALLPRHPNFIWAQMANDRLTAGLIADGWHLPADTFKAMLRAKGEERVILVSDTVALAGMPAGRYDQPVGGAVEVSPEGRISVAGTPYLAGASLPLCANVAIAVQMASLPLGQALKLATVNPGRFAGGRGVLEVGARADLILFNWNEGDAALDIQETLVAGERVFRS